MIVVTAADTVAAQEDRFHSFQLIGWWDQSRLSRAKVLVVGAGALGNEIVKNLALLGIGNLLIADMDHIENSNLSRSVLYRAEDAGRFKAEVAAAAAQAIYPDIKVHSFSGNVVTDFGIGLFHWADIVIGGLDNREARLAINRNCWRVNRPWIDGAIEQVQGCARVFVPDGPCYECTMSAIDWQLIQKRRSCNLLSAAEMEKGKTPTTPTISSIIAGVQCQEAVKWLHGLPTIHGRGWIFEGLSGDSYQIEYQRKEECYGHDLLDEIVNLDARSDQITVRQLCARARALLGDDVVLELGRDMLEKLHCPKCGAQESLFTSLGQVSAAQAMCPRCQDSRREVVTFYKLDGTEPFADRTLRDIGVPPLDVIIGRTTERSVGLLLVGDAPEALGPLLDVEDGVL
ncbi:MAG: ThiF family adenylyltransferase [Planctomycetes bacterium]|nr:ThiF family adenylyltransferase [Planctomycetota bacterium]